VADISTGARFALKHLRLGGDLETIAEVQREAKAMAKLKGHPNILRLHAVSFAGPRCGRGTAAAAAAAAAAASSNGGGGVLLLDAAAVYGTAGVHVMTSPAVLVAPTPLDVLQPPSVGRLSGPSELLS
jgi:hypothetical protein